MKIESKHAIQVYVKILTKKEPFVLLRDQVEKLVNSNQLLSTPFNPRHFFAVRYPKQDIIILDIEKKKSMSRQRLAFLSWVDHTYLAVIFSEQYGRITYQRTTQQQPSISRIFVLVAPVTIKFEVPGYIVRSTQPQGDYSHHEV